MAKRGISTKRGKSTRKTRKNSRRNKTRRGGGKEKRNSVVTSRPQPYTSYASEGRNRAFERPQTYTSYASEALTNEEKMQLFNDKIEAISKGFAEPEEKMFRGLFTGLFAEDDVIARRAVNVLTEISRTRNHGNKNVNDDNVTGIINTIKGSIVSELEQKIADTFLIEFNLALREAYNVKYDVYTLK